MYTASQDNIEGTKSDMIENTKCDIARFQTVVPFTGEEIMNSLKDDKSRHLWDKGLTKCRLVQDILKVEYPGIKEEITFKFYTDGYQFLIEETFLKSKQCCLWIIEPIENC
jgi:hypothetical protein